MKVGDELAERMRQRVIRRQRWRLDSACHRAKARLLARDALHQPTRVAKACSRGLHSKPGGANREATHDGQEHPRERACSLRERGNHVREEDAQRAATAGAAIAIRTEQAPSSTLHLARCLRITAQPSVPIERADCCAVRACVKLDRVERAIDVADKSRRSSKAARRHLGGRYERDVEGGKRAESRRSTRPRSGCWSGRGFGWRAWWGRCGCCDGREGGNTKAAFWADASRSSIACLRARRSAAFSLNARSSSLSSSTVQE